MPIKDAKEAAELARETLRAAGVGVNYVTKVEKVGKEWWVRAASLGDDFKVRIDDATGNVVSFEKVEKP